MTKYASYIVVLSYFSVEEGYRFCHLHPKKNGVTTSFPGSLSDHGAHSILCEGGPLSCGSLSDFYLMNMQSVERDMVYASSHTALWNL